MPRSRKIATAIAGLALVAGLYGLWNQDARRINRRLAALVKLANKTPVETQLRGAAKARSIAGFFGEPFELIAEPENFAASNRQDLIRGIIAYRSRAGSLAVDVVRKELFVDSGNESATHYAVVRFVVDFGDLMGTDSYPVQIEWVQEGGEWKIRKLEILREERRAP